MKGKKKLVKVLAAVAVFGAMLSLAGCGGSDNAEKASAPKKLHIDVIAKGFQHQFWKAVEKGTKEAAAKYDVDVTFQGPDNESAIAQQIEYLNAAIANKPAAICLAALDTKAELGSIQQAKEDNIPIIGFDSGVPDAPKGAIKANASTNNTKAGELAATHMYDLLKDRIAKAEADGQVVRIGVVAQESNSQSIVSRTKGFVDEMKNLIGAQNVSVEGHDSLKALNPNAKVIIDVGIPADVKDVDAAAVASALLEKPDLIGIYGSNEFAANAIITANEGLDKIGPDSKAKVVAVGFDAGSKLLNAIKSGLFAGAVTQDPVQIGYQAVKLAVEAAKGQPVKDVDTGALWYNAKNMEDPKIAPCLYK